MSIKESAFLKLFTSFVVLIVYQYHSMCTDHAKQTGLLSTQYALFG